MPFDARTRIFRILVPAVDLATSQQFYEFLLGHPGRQVAQGRVYIDYGDVILGILDYSRATVAERPHPVEAIYFSVATRELLLVHRRARRLGCLSKELLHGDTENPLGEICVRPWGERSFYVDDPAGNSLCFVDAPTVFTGTPGQVKALARSSPRIPPRSRGVRRKQQASGRQRRTIQNGPDS